MMENNNKIELLLNNYYEENFGESDFDNFEGIRYYSKIFKKDKYHGFVVHEWWSESVLELDNKGIVEYNKASFLFSLPIHIDILDELNIKVANNAFIYFCFELPLTDNENRVNFLQKILFQISSFHDEIELVYYFDTYLSVKETDNNFILLQFFICVEQNKIDKLKNKMEKLFRKYNNIFRIKKVYNIKEFFNGYLIISNYDLVRFTVSHGTHGFLIYKLNEDLEDLYVLGLHLNRIESENLLVNNFQSNIAYNFNISHDLIYDVKRRIISKINNFYLNQCIDHYIIVPNLYIFIKNRCINIKKLIVGRLKKMIRRKNGRNS